jgi:hypothetical protein
VIYQATPGLDRPSSRGSVRAATLAGALRG